MTVIARWWCCAEYARTGAQHDEACEYALLGDRADVLVQVKADYARLAHQHRGAVEDVADLVNALADAASRFRRDGDVFGAEQAEAILKRFGGQ